MSTGFAPVIPQEVVDSLSGSRGFYSSGSWRFWCARPPAEGRVILELGVLPSPDLSRLRTIGSFGATIDQLESTGTISFAHLREVGLMQSSISPNANGFIPENAQIFTRARNDEGFVVIWKSR
jgi:hypothetical protein